MCQHANRNARQERGCNIYAIDLQRNRVISIPVYPVKERNAAVCVSEMGANSNANLDVTD